MARPVLAEVVRSGFSESQHAGSVIAVRPDGARVLSLGDPDRTIFPRSANKPFQAAVMVSLGLDLAAELLAVAAASHSGEQYHLKLVDRILEGAGLDGSYLANTPGLPLSEIAAAAVLRAGGGPSAHAQNCSGKHAAMLATCVAKGWPLASYLDPNHPLQLAIATGVAGLVGEPIAATGVDGCGAPLLALSLSGVAGAFQRMLTAEPGTAPHRVADAMRAFPRAVGGADRAVTRLMAGVPRLVAKDGAEGVFAAALPGAGAVAVKIDDGAQRAAVPVLVAGLRALGIDADVLDELCTTAITGGGLVVGSVRVII